MSKESSKTKIKNDPSLVLYFSSLPCCSSLWLVYFLFPSICRSAENSLTLGGDRLFPLFSLFLLLFFMLVCARLVWVGPWGLCYHKAALVLCMVAIKEEYS